MDGKYKDPHGYESPEPIEAVLRRQASQEGCDGEPYDAMIYASRYIDHLKAEVIKAHKAAIDAAAAQVTLGDTVTNIQRKILALKVGNPPDCAPDCAKPFAAEGKVCQFENCKEDALDRITIDGVAKDYCCEHSDSIVKQKGLRWT